MDKVSGVITKSPWIADFNFFTEKEISMNSPFIPFGAMFDFS